MPWLSLKQVKQSALTVAYITVIIPEQVVWPFNTLTWSLYLNGWLIFFKACFFVVGNGLFFPLFRSDKFNNLLHGLTKWFFGSSSEKCFTMSARSDCLDVPTRFVLRMFDKKGGKFGDFDQNTCCKISFAGHEIITCKLQQKISRVKPPNKIALNSLWVVFTGCSFFANFFILKPSK